MGSMGLLSIAGVALVTGLTSGLGERSPMREGVPRKSLALILPSFFFSPLRTERLLQVGTMSVSFILLLHHLALMFQKCFQKTEPCKDSITIPITEK
jgi:hypothetical protein